MCIMWCSGRGRNVSKIRDTIEKVCCHGMARSAAIARDMLVCCSMVRWHVPYHGGPEAHL